ncbi:hypothetical protein QJQ45_017596 [Haematococcus lacustris]|nr:hypothetical protein QJQ45_017596 [Haematococcus lacustris]
MEQMEVVSFLQVPRIKLSMLAICLSRIVQPTPCKERIGLTSPQCPQAARTGL